MLLLIIKLWSWLRTTLKVWGIIHIIGKKIMSSCMYNLCLKTDIIIHVCHNNMIGQYPTSVYTELVYVTCIEAKYAIPVN